MTFCANFLRLSELGWHVKQNGEFSLEKLPILRTGPGRSSYRKAVRTAQKVKITRRPKNGRGALSSCASQIQLQWLGFGFRPALTSRLTAAIKRLDCAPSFPLQAARFPKATQSCRGAKQVLLLPNLFYRISRPRATGQNSIVEPCGQLKLNQTNS